MDHLSKKLIFFSFHIYNMRSQLLVSVIYTELDERSSHENLVSDRAIWIFHGQITIEGIRRFLVYAARVSRDTYSSKGIHNDIWPSYWERVCLCISP